MEGLVAALQRAGRAILRLVEDASLRHRLGEAARAEVVRLNYTWQGNAKQLLDWARADLSELS